MFAGNDKKPVGGHILAHAYSPSHTQVRHYISHYTPYYTYVVERGLIVVLRRGFTCVKDEQRNVLQSYKTVQTVRKKKRAIKSQKEESLIWEHNLPLCTLCLGLCWVWNLLLISHCGYMCWCCMAIWDCGLSVVLHICIAIWKFAFITTMRWVGDTLVQSPLWSLVSRWRCRIFECGRELFSGIWVDDRIYRCLWCTPAVDCTRIDGSVHAEHWLQISIVSVV